MIERQTVDGREATIAYMTADFEPADKDDAELIKVLFDDGDIAFLVPKKAEDKDVVPDEDET
jgi:hypothetical protein